MVNKILQNLSVDETERFDVPDLMIGVRSFNSFWKKLHGKNPRKKLELHEVYATWYQEMDEDRQDIKLLMCKFTRFFESLQVRSSSEVGSKCICIQTSRTYFQYIC
jgi:hypothetical protein